MHSHSDVLWVVVGGVLGFALSILGEVSRGRRRW